MKKIVTFGEIILRLAPHGFLRFSQSTSFDVIYGGGESNVAVSLANYGVPVDFITRLPKNDIGECAMMEMRKRGVNVENIIYGGGRLGIYFLETGAVNRGSKVVYDRAHSAVAEIEPGMIDWAKVFDGAQWFHWTGITVGNMINSIVKESFVVIKKANNIQRKPAPISKLIVGLECGGSDGFSGISANPTLGHVSDLLFALEGTAVLSEFPELCGVEQELVNRLLMKIKPIRF